MLMVIFNNNNSIVSKDNFHFIQRIVYIELIIKAVNLKSSNINYNI